MASNIKFFSRDELKGLLQAARAQNENHFMCLFVTYKFGLRISETLALTAGDFAGGELAAARKKGCDATTQPCDPAILEYVRRFSRDERIFKFGYTNVVKFLKRYCQIAGIPPCKAHSHALRHTCAHLLHDNHLMNEIQSFLGHKSATSTAIYCRVFGGEKSAQTMLMDNPLA